MRMFSKRGVALAAVLTCASAFAAGADSLEGRWDATLTVKTTVIPFRLDISGSGADLKGILYNGDEKEFTTSAKFENGKLVLDFAHYLTTITSTVKDGQLTGKVDQRNGEVGGSAFQAKRYVAPPAVSAADVPSIDGVWETAPEKAGVISFVLEGQRTEDVGSALNREGIAVRSGHHCAQPILRRFGVESTVRPSFALYNTCADIDALIAALIRLTTHRTPF